jgi:hypothetical protein
LNKCLGFIPMEYCVMMLLPETLSRRIAQCESSTLTLWKMDIIVRYPSALVCNNCRSSCVQNAKHNQSAMYHKQSSSVWILHPNPYITFLLVVTLMFFFADMRKTNCLLSVWLCRSEKTKIQYQSSWLKYIHTFLLLDTL